MAGAVERAVLRQGTREGGEVSGGFCSTWPQPRVLFRRFGGRGVHRKCIRRRPRIQRVFGRVGPGL
eukprot:4183587-Lingulodinium_polyedra.AAC.1